MLTMRLCTCIQWQILNDTSLPLSSSVPGVRVESTSAQHSRHLATEDGRLNAAQLTLDWRFYNFLPQADNKFGCLAYTLDGRRRVRYFTVYKLSF